MIDFTGVNGDFGVRLVIFNGGEKYDLRGNYYGLSKLVSNSKLVSRRENNRCALSGCRTFVLNCKLCPTFWYKRYNNSTVLLYVLACVVICSSASIMSNKAKLIYDKLLKSSYFLFYNCSTKFLFYNCRINHIITHGYQYYSINNLNHIIQYQ